MKISDFYLHSRRFGNIVGELQKPSTLMQAYEIQKRNSLELGVVLGWKLGATTLNTQKLFSTQEMCYGAIYQPGVLPAGEDLILPEKINHPVGEIEVCFRLSDRVKDMAEFDFQNRSIHAFIETVVPSIELPWSSLPLPDAGLEVLVADSCASGALIVGSELQWQEEVEKLLAGPVILRDEHETLAKGVVENILDGPLMALTNFLKLSQQHNLALIPGQLVATGGCTSCVKLPRGKSLYVEFEQLGEFSFSLENNR